MSRAVEPWDLFRAHISPPNFHAQLLPEKGAELPPGQDCEETLLEATTVDSFAKIQNEENANQKSDSYTSPRSRSSGSHTSGSHVSPNRSSHANAALRSQGLLDQITTPVSLVAKFSDTTQIVRLLCQVSQLKEDKRLLELQASTGQTRSWKILYKVSCKRGDDAIYSNPPYYTKKRVLGTCKVNALPMILISLLQDRSH